jgi:hypothetical protein
MSEDYTVAELEAALRRAFVDRRADYIVLTSRYQRFQIASANHGIDQGWLRGAWDDSDEQSTAFICRLTDAGRKHFGLKAAGK